jgi:hypothetical protein
VRCGIIPDKLLLHDVFGIRTVIASPEMPNCLSIACENIQPNTTSTATNIVHNHTLYPLYTAFSEADTRQKIKAQMLGSRKNTYTTSSGLATCTLKPFVNFRYCPLCIFDQAKTYGEVFWDRRWFGFYTYCCPIHAIRLTPTNFAIHDAARHSFQPLIDVIHPIRKQNQKISLAKNQETIISVAAAKILTSNASLNLSFKKLTFFYRNLATVNNFNRGIQIRQQEVANYIKEYWTWRWLKSRGFTTDTYEAAIASVFRKHRKQHTYLLHIIAALPFFSGNIDHWFDKLQIIPQYPAPERLTHNDKQLPIVSRDTKQKKAKWVTLVKKYGTNVARYNTKDGAKLYAALYRADREWLIVTNAIYRVKHEMPNHRVNWKNRDWETCKLLFKALFKACDTFSPRRSRRWFLCQLKNSATIEHNLYRLPKTTMFLNAYCESVEEFQCRRLTQTTTSFAKQNISAQPWQLYRNARINAQRTISSHVQITCEWCINWLVSNIK